MKNADCGFTLVELLVVLSIVAIVAMVAVPSFTNVIEKNRVEALQKDLARDIAFARQAAMSRNGLVSICKSANGTGCTTAGDWNQGWIVFVDTAGGTAGTVDGGEEILKVHAAANSNDDMEGTVDFLQFSATGTLRLPAAGTPVFEICAPGNAYVRGLLVLRSGRGLTSRHSGSVEYVERDAGNNPVALSCS